MDNFLSGLVLGLAFASLFWGMVIPMYRAYQAKEAKKAAIRARTDKAMATKRAKRGNAKGAAGPILRSEASGANSGEARRQGEA